MDTARIGRESREDGMIDHLSMGHEGALKMSGQQGRQELLAAKLIEHAVPLFSADGSYVGEKTYPEPDERDCFRLAAILMKYGDDEAFALAEALISRSFGGEHDYTKRAPEQNVVDIRRAEVLDWNIFQSNIATHILVQHGARCRAEVREKLERIARRNLSRWAGSAQADYLFHGANDNMPSGATAGLILGGEYFSDARAISDGIYRLELFSELLSRRGLCSEFASGTYLPPSIQGMAEIASCSQDASIRKRALDIEAQLWGDAVCHYHPGSGKCAGPQTRAYLYNTLGHLDSLMLLLWVVSGKPDFADPVRDIVTVRPAQVVHGGNPFYSAIEMLYGNTTDEFHVPDELLSLMAQRALPFRFSATAEHMFAHAPDTGGRKYVSVAYQTADYSIATVDHGFMTGNQTEQLRVCYRRVIQPKSFEDTGVVFTRMLYDDQFPSKMKQLNDGAALELDGGTDNALGTTVQDDGTAVVVTRGHAHNREFPAHLRKIRQCVIVPAHFHDVESSWIGDDRVDGFSGRSSTAEPVFLDLGRIYVALFPLALTDLGREDVVRLESVGNYRVISFFNYEGPAREFDGEALCEVFNGFVIRVSGPDESGCFERFRESFRLDIVEDWWFCGNRRTRVVLDGRELLINWSTPTDTIRSATVNGREAGQERLSATGLDTSCLPILTRPYFFSDYILPYDNLDIAWYPNLRWQVGTLRQTLEKAGCDDEGPTERRPRYAKRGEHRGY